MININLHDYKLELQKVAIQKLAVRAAVIVAMAIFLTIAYWGYRQVELGHAQTEITKLDDQVKALSGQIKTIDKMKTRTKRSVEIMEGIDTLRAKQFQVTQVMEGLTLTVPDEIWLTSVQQISLNQVFKRKVPVIFIGNPDELNPRKKKKGEREPTEFVEVQGRVFGKYGDQILTRYMDSLREVPYFKEVFLHQTVHQLAGTYPIREFSLYIYIPVKKPDKKK
ncbi:MAG: hypothetical protein QGG38_02365 [Nitrospinaceae bacterium]|jgi:Tfp pilus assembly protein PilN|nr:hypothetical protein [Nitrospinaceae bacterium]MDP6711518.1 hypothetical protein [Nitrospinaceae bacterium]MDP7056794.1 hypothetical protein [Nitrospinaceae bacterium]|tara:strand:- start:144 stop:812 length:669 start_codon:yes stop_codon:yes gene_type:complete